LAIIVTLIYISISASSLIFKKINGKQIEKVQTYSYTWVPSLAIKSFVIATIISAIVYFSTNSIDITISIYAFSIACILAGIIRTALIESRVKRRGGKKI